MPAILQIGPTVTRKTRRFFLNSGHGHRRYSQCAYAHRDGQAELAWWLVNYQGGIPLSEKNKKRENEKQLQINQSLIDEN